MGNWGKSDNASNSVSYVLNQLHKTNNTSNQTALFQNTTPNAFVNGAIVSQVGVTKTEVHATGMLKSVTVTNAGSGYFSAPTVTLSGNATAVSSLTNGKVSAISLTNAGSSYVSSATVTIGAPTATTFAANTTGMTVSQNFIKIASNPFLAGDRFKYYTAAGNTVITGLTNNTIYSVFFANTTGIQVANSSGGLISLTVAVANESGHTVQGVNATATSTLSAGNNSGVTAGWNLKTEGTGGRSGRVTYECLVSMKSIT